MRSLHSAADGGRCARRLSEQDKRRVGECRGGRERVARQGAVILPGRESAGSNATCTPGRAGPRPAAWASRSLNHVLCLQMRQLTDEDFLELENVKSVEMQSNALEKLPDDLLKRGVHLEQVFSLPPHSCPHTHTRHVPHPDAYLHTHTRNPDAHALIHHEAHALTHPPPHSWRARGTSWPRSPPRSRASCTSSPWTSRSTA